MTSLPQQIHGLGRDFEALLLRQLNLTSDWIVTASGCENIVGPTPDAPLKAITFCEIEASEGAKNKAVAEAKCPVCAGPMRRRGQRSKRSWSHLSVLGQPFELRANLMRLQCMSADCGTYSSLQAPWESPSKHFTFAQEEAVIKQVVESGYEGAAKMSGLASSSLHKVVKTRVERAHAKDDWSAVTAIGVDDYAIGEGQTYITIFSDIKARRVLFVAKGRSHDTFAQFVADAVNNHGLKPECISFASMDMGLGYIKGAKEKIPSATIVFDKFHVIKLANDKVDQIRRAEFNKASFEIRAKISRHRWLFLKNHSNLTEKEEQAFSRIDMTSFWTGRAYQIRCALQTVYATETESFARHKMKCLIKWILRLCRKAPAYFATPMRSLANTLQERSEGIFSHWRSQLTNAYHEGLHSVFSAVKRKARGLGFDGMRTLLYLHYGKLNLGFDLKSSPNAFHPPMTTIKLTPLRQMKLAAKEAV